MKLNMLYPRDLIRWYAIHIQNFVDLALHKNLVLSFPIDHTYACRMICEWIIEVALGEL